MYHEIAARPATASSLAVPPEAFEAQLDFLARHDFTTMTASGIAAALSSGAPLPERTVVLTFDDGFADFHHRALPLLSRYCFTATVFVTTGWMADAGKHSAGRGPGPMLSWSQLREAASAGIEIGAHSHQIACEPSSPSASHCLRTGWQWRSPAWLTRSAIRVLWSVRQ
jgi:peptidoglycan/xylan/chitin deacetylase (PgdA/CDA1 family)